MQKTQYAIGAAYTSACEEIAFDRCLLGRTTCLAIVVVRMQILVDITAKRFCADGAVNNLRFGAHTSTNLENTRHRYKYGDLS